jgi:hypothetical protein
MLCGLVRPTTRMAFVERSWVQRRATVWSESPMTRAIVLNGTRPSRLSA